MVVVVGYRPSVASSSNRSRRDARSPHLDLHMRRAGRGHWTAWEGNDMARQVKPEHAHHTFRAVEGDRELLIVGRGRGIYLWIGTYNDQRGVEVALTFSGQKFLAKMGRELVRLSKSTKRRASRGDSRE